ncbi:hypothetical protein K461DRAFT_294904 [Myriangium duriaei CBS 260.36]|uniref:Uncharacterized protein n=1 Tax=Myriangium duriaei CBS 260.36 TaxID=1168546 RepID=A0A9P4IY60_9PEZI|nr:hypothetical protein K461DRAFT_294904 [Myriangium duriaei CBS 260.36]
MPSNKKDPPEVKFARNKLIYVLGAFILGLLCTTHPKRYFQDPDHSDGVNGASSLSRYSPSAESSSTRHSKTSTGSSLARLLNRRKNDEHAFKQAQKAAKPLALACTRVPGEPKHSTSAVPIIVEMSEPVHSAGATPTSASLKQLPIGAGYAETLLFSSPSRTPTESRSSDQSTKANDSPKTPGTPDAHRRRPIFRRGRSVRSSANDAAEVPSLHQVLLNTPVRQSPPSTPLSVLGIGRMKDPPIEHDQEGHQQAPRPMSSSFSERIDFNGSPRPESMGVSYKRKAFFSGLWTRRPGSKSEASTFETPTPLVSPSSTPGNPAVTPVQSRQSYFPKNHHRYRDSPAAFSPGISPSNDGLISSDLPESPHQVSPHTRQRA